MPCPRHNSCEVLHAKMNTSLLQVSLTQFFKQYEHTFHLKCTIGIIKPSGFSCSSPCSTDNMLSHVLRHLLTEATPLTASSPPALPVARERTRLWPQTPDAGKQTEFTSVSVTHKGSRGSFLSVLRGHH